MKALITTIIISFPLFINAQPSTMQYEPSTNQPYGKLNPSAPSQTAEFGDMIGICDCKSISRNPDGTWGDTLKMAWKFKYIMNGFAIQDEVWRENGMYAGSIRQYHTDSAKWVVTYFSYPGVSTKPGVWHGNKEGKDIVLYMDQNAPNGIEGKSRLTFYDITTEGFNWKGEWINNEGTITYPFWMIYCRKSE